MRTTLDIDAKLLDEVVKATGEKSKSRAVQMVMQEYIRRKAIDELRAMAGNFQIDDSSEEQAAAEAKRQSTLDKLRRL